MPAAAIPGIIMAASAAATAAGSIYSATQQGGSSAGTFSTEAVWPGVSQNYIETIAGGAGKWGARGLQEMAQTGMPTDVGEMFESLVASQRRFAEQGRGDILEQFGASGLRYSEPLMQSLVDYESQLSANYGNILANYVFQAQEAARNRQLQASQFGVQAWSQPALTIRGQASAPGYNWGDYLAMGGQAAGSIAPYISNISSSAAAAPTVTGSGSANVPSAAGGVVLSPGTRSKLAQSGLPQIAG
jgi:hypothetical protein